MRDVKFAGSYRALSGFRNVVRQMGANFVCGGPSQERRNDARKGVGKTFGDILLAFQFRGKRQSLHRRPVLWEMDRHQPMENEGGTGVIESQP